MALHHPISELRLAAAPVRHLPDGLAFALLLAALWPTGLALAILPRLL